jgi:hypothetical protein
MFPGRSLAAEEAIVAEDTFFNRGSRHLQESLM